MEAHAREIIALQDVERLAQRHAARARWRCGDDMIAAIIALDRFELANLVPREIGPGEDAATGLARIGDRGTDWTVIKGVGALGGDRRERVGEISLNEPVAL